MLTYNFANIGSDSLYEFLYKCIKNDIIQGIILSGEKLPSKRALAKNLAISVITVENAYGQLLAEGYIYSIPKSGYYVSDLSGIPVHQTEYTSETYEAEEQGTDSRTAKAGDKVLLTGGENAFIADFTSNQTEHAAFPFSIWNKTMRAVMNDYQEEMMINPPCGGVMELRKSISSYLKEFCAMYVRPEQIIIGAGTEYLYSILIQLLGRNVCYGVENPGYPKIAKIYRSMGVKYEYIDLDEEGTSAKKLEEKKVDIMHISPSHHFPTGMVMPISKRYELLGWVTREKERYIIEDDYDSEFRYKGKPIPALQGYDRSGKVIYIGTFSKSIAPAIRMSYLVLPERVCSLYKKRCGFISSTVSKVDQLILQKFIEKGYYERHLNKTRALYRSRHDVLLSTLKEMKTEFTVSGENAGVHLLLHFCDGRSEKELIRLAEEKEVKVYGLSEYYVGEKDREQNESVILLGYANMSDEKILHAARLLDEAWNKEGN